MKKSNWLILLVTLILACIAVYFFLNDKSFTIKKELRNFAIADTASVDKIFLADKAGNKITLEKSSPGNWILNNQYPARNEAVNLLLSTMKNLVVKNPVAKAAHDNLMKHMSANAIKTEIYQNKDLVKTYYVGGATQDQLGTFMLLENSSAAFVMTVPGHNGYLSSRYFTELNQWRSRVVFGTPLNQISSLEINYPVSPSKSFRIVANEGAFKLITQGNEVEIKDTMQVMGYLSYFKNIQYELVIRKIDPAKKDSVLRSQPLAILTLKKMDNNSESIRLFAMPVNEHSIVAANEDGPLKADVDRMYGLLADSGFVIVQHFVFDKLLVDPEGFVKAK